MEYYKLNSWKFNSVNHSYCCYSVFNMEVNEVVPLHSALKRKLFAHSMILLKLEATNGKLFVFKELIVFLCY